MALQPNFAILNHAIGQVSTELAKFQNLPQIADAQAILNVLQQLQEALDNRVQDINNNIEGLDARLNGNIEGLEARLTRRMKARFVSTRFPSFQM